MADDEGYKFPYPVLAVQSVTILIALIYAILRWRQKPKSTYVIPRVFVLCSPRTVQYHFELILRVGLHSYDFNPDKHDIDLTVLGQQKNEIIPMTRLNTKTLLDEPLITSLSIIVYRLVDMPQLGSLMLRHSGPFKSWVYAYDFTMIDLSTNKEYYYTLNQYIGSLNRVLPLDQSGANQPVHYPIDDVPMPQWQLEDIIIFLFLASNCIILAATLMPINCSYYNDIVSILVASLTGGSVVFLLHWFFYYYIKWNQDRKEYFNEFETASFCPGENVLRIVLIVAGIGANGCASYFGSITQDWRGSVVWLLVVTNCLTLVIGFWNVFRQAEIGERLVEFGLRLRGIDTVGIGMRFAEMVADIRTKSGSASEDGGGSTISGTSRFGKSFGPRSSVKSFGFDPITGHPSRKALSKFEGGSRISATGATPNNQPSSQILRLGVGAGATSARTAAQAQAMQAPRSKSSSSAGAKEKAALGGLAGPTSGSSSQSAMSALSKPSAAERSRSESGKPPRQPADKQSPTSGGSDPKLPHQPTTSADGTRVALHREPSSKEHPNKRN